MSNDIRPVTTKDIPALLPLIRQYWLFEDVAGFEPARVGRELEGAVADPKLASGWIAFARDEPVGYLLAVYVFSLEHLGLTAEIDEFFVLPSARGKGIGQALLKRVASIAAERGCARFEWSVLDWNQSAIDFYQRLGATVMPDWRIARVTGPALMQLADR